MLDIVHLERSALRQTNYQGRPKTVLIASVMDSTQSPPFRFDRNGNGSSETRGATFA